MLNRNARQIVSVTVVLAFFVILGIQYIQTHKLQVKVTTLTHACIPIDTGGGVTQCMQPSTTDTAIHSCLSNSAYIGMNTEDNRALFSQCIDDYRGIKTSAICREDMLCWDCHTMGNNICGNNSPQVACEQLTTDTKRCMSIFLATGKMPN